MTIGLSVPVRPSAAAHGTAGCCDAAHSLASGTMSRPILVAGALPFSSGGPCGAPCCCRLQGGRLGGMCATGPVVNQLSESANPLYCRSQGGRLEERGFKKGGVADDKAYSRERGS